MALHLECRLVPDAHGHGEGLLLKGDHLFVLVSDGIHAGIGEASHSGDDRACVRQIKDLFKRFVNGIALSLESIRDLEQDELSSAPDFLTATAVSGINQALYELLAKREDVPVWRLLSSELAQEQVPVYATINRALTTRTAEDYLSVITDTQYHGLKAIKCAPFERVTAYGDQLECSREGLAILRRIRSEYPDLNMMIDFHRRFNSEVFMQLLPELDGLSPSWLEEPCEYGNVYEEITRRTSTPIAAGESYFRREDFDNLLDCGWANVVMPDVKHVGGLGPLLDICQSAERHQEVEVSLHNPSGPVSTLASLHAAAVSELIASLEVPFIVDESQVPYRDLLGGGSLQVPDGPGWGIDLSAAIGKGASI
ncbi:MAG: hypothetical protein JSU77_09675 [Fidelibacterota bacterium]|nr:MAG: hypothetical protein JSU77_09675 [Candidatus Neomarinimicrobiota bacterium]